MFIEEDFEDFICEAIDQAVPAFNSVASLDGINLNAPEQIGRQVGNLPACRVMVNNEEYFDTGNSAQHSTLKCDLLVLVFASDASRDRGRKALPRELCRAVKQVLRGLKFKAGRGQVGKLRIRRNDPMISYKSLIVYQQEYTFTIFDSNENETDPNSQPSS